MVKYFEEDMGGGETREDVLLETVLEAGKIQTGVISEGEVDPIVKYAVVWSSAGHSEMKIAFFRGNERVTPIYVLPPLAIGAFSQLSENGDDVFVNWLEVLPYGRFTLRAISVDHGVVVVEPADIISAYTENSTAGLPPTVNYSQTFTATTASLSPPNFFPGDGTARSNDGLYVFAKDTLTGTDTAYSLPDQVKYDRDGYSLLRVSPDGTVTELIKDEYAHRKISNIGGPEVITWDITENYPQGGGGLLNVNETSVHIDSFWVDPIATSGLNETTIQETRVFSPPAWDLTGSYDDVQVEKSYAYNMHGYRDSQFNKFLGDDIGNDITPGYLNMGNNYPEKTIVDGKSLYLIDTGNEVDGLDVYEVWYDGVLKYSFAHEAFNQFFFPSPHSGLMWLDKVVDEPLDYPEPWRRGFRTYDIAAGTSVMTLSFDNPDIGTSPVHFLFPDPASV